MVLTAILSVLSTMCSDPFIIGLIVLVIGAVLFRKFQIQFMKVEKSFSVNNQDCTDSNCVRCTKYKEVLQTAQTKLKHYENKDCYERITNSSNISDPLKHTSEQNPNIIFYKKLKAQPVWNKETFRDTQILESDYGTIKKEFKSLVNNTNYDGWKRNNTPSGSWDVYPLINQGREIPENCKKCPKTMAIINSLPSMMSKNVFVNAMFSIVHPSTVITEHYGPCNIRLRCHLGLITPAECVLNVADYQLQWAEGQCLVFDDSFLHSVTFTSSLSEEEEGEEENFEGSADDPPNYRAVLIVDLWHPELSQEEREVFSDVFSPE